MLINSKFTMTLKLNMLHGVNNPYMVCKISRFLCRLLEPVYIYHIQQHNNLYTGIVMLN